MAGVVVGVRASRVARIYYRITDYEITRARTTRYFTYPGIFIEQILERITNKLIWQVNFAQHPCES